MKTISLLLFSCVLLAAQTATDTFRVNYFSSLQSGATFTSQPSSGTYANGNAYNTPTVSGATTADETVSIVNPGTDGIVPGTSTGDLCALIYVVDTAEELQECCGCLVTPDQMIELSAQRDLDSNPYNGSIVHSGAIKIISSAPTGAAAGEYDNSVCDPGTPNPTPALREWITHTRLLGGTTGVTETPFSEATLSTAGAGSELAFLGAQCTHIRTQGSGSGRCNCPTPNYGATFSFTGGPQTFTVPTSGTYHIVAAGAQGGSPIGPGTTGGLGAEVAGDFVLTVGQVLDVDVAGAGGGNSGIGGGGGGGSFVVLSGTTPTPLLIAAGGGGGGAGNGTDGNATQNGSASTDTLAPGGMNGNGGGGGINTETAGGGGGFYTSGTPGQAPRSGGGGQSFFAGLAGGSHGIDAGVGGYGGGGGGAYSTGGGGGGYSGGGGATFGGGGGGGSFNSGANQTNTPGVNSNNGFITITFVHP